MRNKKHLTNITENISTLLKYIQFNQQYNISLLKAELDIALQQDWVDHFNKKDYEGDWQSISLRSASGKEQDILANYGVDQYQDTPLLNQLPYIKSIIEEWQCPKETIRLLALHPGAEIKPHRDRGCNYEAGVLRIHIPIQTNNQLKFIVGDEQLILEEGSCWYIDFDQTHSIINGGENIRVHLVIDALRNEWTDQLFEANGYNFAQENQAPDRDTTLKMIAELEQMDTPVAKTLVAQLKKNLE
ncbi:aspartyl/asparaginyl beta-hydroxylase domain-containing protein [Pedobacter rhizosphaerae]|uniref:Aspartyl/Asparaginyl beta-hydroxylase n=1 Tax=Pedobacter rhizosphaerae TaxID=390241 RepID=A0A1H9TWB9_9SPHI|nr:aspartyl/asparaginyl beta-hydroxylase domain-containing protein [Pedobacter rhizosphaerae]SES01331.1 Aspartyl/Asparaginyl beta-hydroxylase [Pedobacter rhizosphaerae]